MYGCEGFAFHGVRVSRSRLSGCSRVAFQVFRVPGFRCLLFNCHTVLDFEIPGVRDLRFRFQVWDFGFEFPGFRFQDLRIQGSGF